MNGDVYRFVYNNVPRGNEIEHSTVPPAPNGSNPKSFKALTQKSEKIENESQYFSFQFKKDLVKSHNNNNNATKRSKKSNGRDERNLSIKMGTSLSRRE